MNCKLSFFKTFRAEADAPAFKYNENSRYNSAYELQMRQGLPSSVWCTSARKSSLCRFIVD